MRAGLLLHLKNLKIKYLMCKTHNFLTGCAGCTFIQSVPVFSRQTLSVYSTGPDRKEMSYKHTSLEALSKITNVRYYGTKV